MRILKKTTQVEEATKRIAFVLMDVDVEEMEPPWVLYPPLNIHACRVSSTEYLSSLGSFATWNATCNQTSQDPFKLGKF